MLNLKNVMIQIKDPVLFINEEFKKNVLWII